ncbi:MAG: FAD-dependent oxidoreductase [Firmicutes bacterium]|jgi:NADPH-dependent 2,4-dienoyl-CoA reductase/sulfur reductase-like enzyme/rhodanese-related sulfurtransferase|nr:FAD-dependent oxidoreductase [Bacillota bacterium]
MSTRILVVGGAAGGAGAAVKARRVNEQAEIVMFERTADVSWANCGLPYYVGGVISDRSELFVTPPSRLASRFAIDVRTGHDVTEIDRGKKTVTVRELATGKVMEERYDRLILATGSEAIDLGVPGGSSPKVFNLLSIAEADRLRSFVEETGPARAVVIGGGFIGLEGAEALLERGLEVTLVEAKDQLLPTFDPEMVSGVSRELARKGVWVLVSERVARIDESEKQLTVHLQSGTAVECDLVVAAVGVRPRLDLARRAGLQVGPTGGLVVNSRMQTSAPDIYAAGDICEVNNRITGKPTRVPLAGPANKQARVAGANAAGGNLHYHGTLGAMVVKVYDVVVAKAGLTEREARDERLAHFVSFTHSLHHAGYYPGPRPLTIKLIAEKPTGRILGAEVTGQGGVDKRIDVLSTAMWARMTVFDLEDLDLSYAPPYSSAKDPVNIAGFTAANILRGEVEAISPQEAAKALREGDVQLLDVRTQREAEAGVIEGATLTPVDQLRDHLEELNPFKDIIAYCAAGYRSYIASRILTQRGFENVRHISGGYEAWKMAQEGSDADD